MRATCVQAFARLSAVYGGTYMLSKPDAQVVYDEAGKATGVTSEGETVQAKFVVGDPSACCLAPPCWGQPQASMCIVASSKGLMCWGCMLLVMLHTTDLTQRQHNRGNEEQLRTCTCADLVAALQGQASLNHDHCCVCVAAGYFPDKVEKAGRVVRAIAVLAHPIPNTDNAASAQIILPQRQTGRKNDIYVFCCSASHHVCAADKWLAFVSTIVETTDPERELLPGA